MASLSIRSGALPLLIGVALAATGCIQGKPAPPVTEMATIGGGTFIFGDEEICNNASVAPQNRVSCENLGVGSASARLRKVYPSVSVTLEQFQIDVHEVTNLQYKYCVAMDACTEPEHTNAQNIANYYNEERYDEYPVVNVSFDQAQDYCRFVGKRLPTEYEWERVAGGGTEDPAQKRRYPFEDNADTEDDESEDITLCTNTQAALFYCNTDRNPRPVGRSTHDRVNEGGTWVYDLGGNVHEWVLDAWEEDVTCETAFSTDCKDCFACDDTIDPDCKLTCNDCQECRDDAESCFVECPGTGPSLYGYPICFRYTETRVCGLTETGDSSCGPDPGSTGTGFRAYRGGSYLTPERETCTVRSADRSQRRVGDEHTNDHGFRCAASID